MGGQHVGLLVEELRRCGRDLGAVWGLAIDINDQHLHLTITTLERGDPETAPQAAAVVVLRAVA
jgi:hypothetical protein